MSGKNSNQMLSISDTNNCIICFRSCIIHRKNIQPYDCSCNYYIHKTCYTKWKQTGTLRLCVMCQVMESESDEDSDIENIFDEAFIRNQYIIEREIRDMQYYEEYQQRWENTRKKIALTIAFLLLFYIFLIFPKELDGGIKPLTANRFTS